MKRSGAFIYLFLFFLNYVTCSSKVIIKGEVVGKKHSTISHSDPIYGTSFWGFTKKIELDINNNFELEFDSKTPFFKSFFVTGTGVGGFAFIEPGKTYFVKIDLEANQNQFKVLGENEKGVSLYNELEFNKSPSIQHCLRAFYSGTNNLDTVLKNIFIERQNVKNRFYKMLEAGDVTKSFYNASLININCYYSALKATAYWLSFYQNNLDLSLFKKEKDNPWHDIFVEHDPSMQKNLISKWCMEYMDAYVKYKECEFYAFNLDKINTQTKSVHSTNLCFAKNIYKSKVLEYYSARYIYFTSIQKKYEEELIDLFDEFQKEFPKSRFINYIIPHIERIKEFHNKSISLENKFFIDDPEKITTLDCLVTTVGKERLYIILWATWCGPCKREFINFEIANEFFIEKNIDVIFISVDKEAKDEQWKKMINYYNLKGYHIRVDNSSLINDIKKLFDSSLPLPSFLFITKNEEISVNKIAGLSEFEKLKKEVLNSLN